MHNGALPGVPVDCKFGSASLLLKESGRLVASKNLKMKGLMQDYPLVVTSLLDYAEKFHAEQEVITCTVEGGIHRYTYADMHKRAQLCSLALYNLRVR